MLSLRNQDKMMLVNPSEGNHANWTLDGEENYSVMFEQYNTDYIPDERDGPAAVLAASQNDRIIEFQREGDSWNQTRVWSDKQMFWPRDAEPTSERIDLDYGQ